MRKSRFRQAQIIRIVCAPVGAVVLRVVVQGLEARGVWRRPWVSGAGRPGRPPR
jgi:hypothetical protein